MLRCSDGFGSKIFDPGWVGSIFCGSCQFGLGQQLMVWVWISKISLKNVKLFNFFPFGSKKYLWVGSKSTWVEGGLASYLLRVKSKLGLGQGPSLLRCQLWNSHLEKGSLQLNAMTSGWELGDWGSIPGLDKMLDTWIWDDQGQWVGLRQRKPSK